MNVLVGNLLDAQAERYDVSDAGPSRLVREFYDYRFGVDGAPKRRWAAT